MLPVHLTWPRACTLCVQGEVGGLMAEAEKKLAKCKSSTSKMPGVLKMLQGVM